MIHVVYTIRNKDRSVHDIIVHSDSDWKDGKLITGGLTESLRKDYPVDDYNIEVEVLTSHGNQTND